MVDVDHVVREEEKDSLVTKFSGKQKGEGKKEYNELLSVILNVILSM